MWRLHFLKRLSPESRRALLQKVAARTHSTETRQLIALLGQMHEEGADLDGTGLFMQRALPLLYPPEGGLKWEELEKLSRIIRTDETVRNDYNLSPSRYVAVNGAEEVLPLEEAVVLLAEAEEERQAADTELNRVLQSLGVSEVSHV